MNASEKPDPLMCILSYFGIFALIPFLVKKDDPYISWHARQGVFLMLATFAAFVVMMVLMFIPLLGLLMIPVYALVSLGVIGLSVYCMVQAINGKRWPIPVLAKLVGMDNESNP
jgi:uncharacterized membrane protein